MRVDRIGHGTRACEDPRLVTALAARHVHVEACPLSNVRTGVIDSLVRHPVRRLFDAGVRVSVSTDDPKMFGTSLAEELRGLHEQLGFSINEIRALTLQAAQDSWLPQDHKQRLIASLDGDPIWREDPV